MGKLGKFIVGCSVVGAAAGAIYYLLQQSGQNYEVVEEDIIGDGEEFSMDSEETKETPDAEPEAEADQAEDTAAEGNDEEKTEEIYVEDIVAENVAKIQDAASRAYTTIRHSSDEAAAAIREKIGPKGEEVLGVAKENAGKIREAVVDSAVRIKDIMKKEDDGATAEEQAVEEVLSKETEEAAPEETEEAASEETKASAAEDEIPEDPEKLVEEMAAEADREIETRDDL